MSKKQHEKAPGPSTVPVRILSDWGGYRCGQYAEVSSDLAGQLISGGIADDSDAAVAFAKALSNG